MVTGTRPNTGRFRAYLFLQRFPKRYPAVVTRRHPVATNPNAPLAGPRKTRMADPLFI